MKKSWFFIIAGFLFVSCGTLRVTPKGCKTKAVFAANPEASREVTNEELEDKENEITAKKTLIVIKDTEIRIKDLLHEKGLGCEDVKKLRVRIRTSWFFSREVEIKAVKN